MKLIVEIRDEWPDEALHAASENGSNDQEHDLLVEIADAVVEALEAGQEIRP